MDFTSRQLRAFHLVAEHRNFTRAAEALFLTPSGLSVLVRELERQVGFRLFHRTTRNVILTAQGSELLALTLPALQALDDGISGIEQATKRKNQRILIGANPWFAAHVLPPAIREFRAKMPDLQIDLFDSDPDALVACVEANKLDFALGIFERTPGIRRSTFFRFSLVLVQPDDGRSHSHVSPWSVLGGHPLISLAGKYPHEPLIHARLRKIGVVARRSHAVNLLDTQIGLVEAGLGIAVIPSYGIMATRSRKVRISRLEPAITLDFHEITNRGRKLPPEASQFGAFLKAYLTRRVGDER